MVNYHPHNILLKSVEDEITRALYQDFREVLRVNPMDRKEDVFSFSMETFHNFKVEVMYIRKVISDDRHSIVIPHIQYIFGFRPKNGFCILTGNKKHKKMLCDGPIRELAKHCPLTQSLQYVLVPKVGLEKYKVWSYIPVCCNEHETCPAKTRGLEFRRHRATLFREEQD